MFEQLRLLNPWWSTSEPWSEDVVPSRFRRRAFGRLVEALESATTEPAVLLAGFRRIGKTVLAKQCLRHFHEQRGVPREQLVYVDFQEDSCAGLEPREVVEFARSRRSGPAPAIVVLDEIQFVPDWDKKLRGIVAAPAKDLVLLASGSSAGELRRPSGDVLLDRVRVVHIAPMTFGEWLRMAGVQATAPLPALHNALLRYHTRGGFPGMIGETSDREARRRLRELCEQRVIDGDLVHRLGLRNRVTFGKLWQHFVHNPGATLDWSKLPGEFGVARGTFEDWVHALLQSEMVVELLPCDSSGKPLYGRKRYSRVYPVDHALCAAYGIPVDEGPGLEALVLGQLRELQQRRQERGRPSQLSYWRDDKLAGPNEIDFRLEGDDVALLVEVKGARRVGQRDVDRLAQVARRLERTRAVLVHGGDERGVAERELSGQRVAIHLWPVPAFLLALDGGGLAAEELLDADRPA